MWRESDGVDGVKKRTRCRRCMGGIGWENEDGKDEYLRLSLE